MDFGIMFLYFYCSLFCGGTYASILLVERFVRCFRKSVWFRRWAVGVWVNFEDFEGFWVGLGLWVVGSGRVLFSYFCGCFGFFDVGLLVSVGRFFWNGDVIFLKGFFLVFDFYSFYVVDLCVNIFYTVVFGRWCV